MFVEMWYTFGFPGPSEPGALLVSDVWDVNDAIQSLIRARVPVEDRRLADPDVPLEELARTDRVSPR